MTKKGRICLPMLLATLVLLAFVTAAERARRQHAEESAAQDQDERQ